MMPIERNTAPKATAEEKNARIVLLLTGDRLRLHSMSLAQIVIDHVTSNARIISSHRTSLPPVATVGRARADDGGRRGRAPGASSSAIPCRSRTIGSYRQ